MRRLRFALAAIVATTGATASRSAVPIAVDCRAHAPEAASRSGLGIDVLLRVMQAESGGSATIVSVKGAMGCMQIMPTTWTDLSRRYGLGSDPYNARMNMIGGALYLAELGRRFGWPGAFAAYNAGPSRYMRHATDGVPLPTETVAYTARLGGVAAPGVAAPGVATLSRVRWQEARLFLARGNDGVERGLETVSRTAAVPGAASEAASAAALPAARNVSILFPLSTIAPAASR